MRPDEIEALAENGIVLDISSNVNLKPETLERLVYTTVQNEGHLIVSASSYRPETIQTIAKIGGKNITIKL